MGDRKSSVWDHSGAWMGQVGRLVGPVHIWGATGASCHFGAGGPLETAAEGMVRVSRGLCGSWGMGLAGEVHMDTQGGSGRVRGGELGDSIGPP